jgi:aspartyl-tRNA(Asn)/glutamyl-tRNA(Gln) amidotransferase subunit A
MQYSDYPDFRKRLFAGEMNLTDVVEHFLARIDELAHLNVFLEVYADEARQKAIEISEKIRNGNAGRLAGMVIGLKDIIAYKDHGLQCGSKILDGFVSQFSATAVQRLINEDVIIIGRQNCDEFGMGSANENSAFGPTLNFLDETKVPGGSSGASAVAVSAGMCHASLGSDTGGSVRQPSAFCGTVGLKPTYGRISRWGLAAYASSFDCIGPLTNSVTDSALLLEIMAGKDEYDSTASSTKVENYSAFSSDLAPLRIGYFKDAFDSAGLDPGVKKATEDKLEALRAQGHTIKELNFPEIKYLLPVYYTLTMAEASSNLARYDGVRYGHRAANTTRLEELYKKSRGEGFGKEVKRRILLGTFILSADYYDAYYARAQKVRSVITAKTKAFFEEVDFILSPTAPTPAFDLGRKVHNPTESYLADIFTVHANVCGLPALSLPNGQSPDGLPYGLQILAPAFAEKDLLNFAKHIE